jgi:hypothetical protein
VVGGRHFPQFLDAEAEGLGSTPSRRRNRSNNVLVSEPRPSAKACRRRAADAGLEVFGRLAVLADAHVAGGDADDAAILAIEHLGRGEAG